MKRLMLATVLSLVGSTAAAQYPYYTAPYYNYGAVPVVPVQPMGYTSFYSPQIGGFTVGPGYTSIQSPYGSVQTFNPRVNAGEYYGGGYGAGYGGGYRYPAGGYGRGYRYGR